jgi:hypothetical protein
MRTEYRETLSNEKIMYSVGNYREQCPYNKCSVCAASFSNLRIDPLKNQNFCSSENYDDCPIFLAKILRRS